MTHSEQVWPRKSSKHSAGTEVEPGQQGVAFLQWFLWLWVSSARSMVPHPFCRCQALPCGQHLLQRKWKLLLENAVAELASQLLNQALPKNSNFSLHVFFWVGEKVDYNLFPLPATPPAPPGPLPPHRFPTSRRALTPEQRTQHCPRPRTPPYPLPARPLGGQPPDSPLTTRRQKTPWPQSSAAPSSSETTRLIAARRQQQVCVERRRPLPAAQPEL